MKYGVYAIKDAKVGFMACTCDTNDSTARRNFEYEVRRPESLLRSHPNDFSLYCLGEYDSSTGVITSCEPIQLVDASQVLREV